MVLHAFHTFLLFMLNRSTFNNQKAITYDEMDLANNQKVAQQSQKELISVTTSLS